MTPIGFSWIAVLSAAIVFCASCGSPSNSGAAGQGAATASVPTVEVAKVSAKKLSIMVRLPGELQAYETVAVFPKVTAYVDSISVDRGSHVKTGQFMARLVAPELAA
jgi:membrane fusion protein, multidrug efflux system